jgi:hypothetical protein
MASWKKKKKKKKKISVDLISIALKTEDEYFIHEKCDTRRAEAEKPLNIGVWRTG